MIFPREYRKVFAMKKSVWVKAATVIGLSMVVLCCGTIVQPREVAGRKAVATQARSPQKLEQDWNTFLKKHVSAEGLVDYTAVKANPEELESIYAQVSRFSPENAPELFATKEERFAYWLNAYNIAVIKGVNEHYPIESVLAVKPFSVFSLIKKGGFFVGQKFVFGGQNLNLYKVENGVIRKGFVDPRLHFALNCASESCPTLAREAYQGKRLEEQLEKQTRAFINSPRAYRIDKGQKQIALSKLFDWYKKDFVEELNKSGNPTANVLDYLEKYLDGGSLSAFKQARQQGYQVTFQSYDWSLNDSQRKKTAP